MFFLSQVVPKFVEGKSEARCALKPTGLGFRV